MLAATGFPLYFIYSSVYYVDSVRRKCRHGQGRTQPNRDINDRLLWICCMLVNQPDLIIFSPSSASVSNVTGYTTYSVLFLVYREILTPSYIAYKWNSPKLHMLNPNGVKIRL